MKIRTCLNKQTEPGEGRNPNPAKEETKVNPEPGGKENLTQRKKKIKRKPTPEKEEKR